MMELKVGAVAAALINVRMDVDQTVLLHVGQKHPIPRLRVEIPVNLHAPELVRACVWEALNNHYSSIL